MTVRELTWAQVSARRLARHGLRQPFGEPVAAVAAMCGAHAQVMSAAELSVGLRLPGGTRSVVREALWTGRTLVKTFGPRGTVHLLPSAELALWTAALSAVPTGNGLPEHARLTPQQTDAVVSVIGEALTADLTTEELHAAVVAGTGSWAGDRVMPAFGELWPRWRQAIGTAAHRGVLCFGPNRGRAITYAKPRLTGVRPSAESALTEVLRRYLYAYGPASPAHFAQWLAAPRAWAAERFAAMDLEPVTVAGADLWQLPDDASSCDGDLPEVVVLPYFDPYVVGGQPRESLFAGRAAERALSRTGQAGAFPVVLADGVVAGVWHLRRSGRKALVTVEPIGRWTARRRELVAQQVERIGEIAEAATELTFGEVTVGSHA